jgi:hypothetical protein
MLSHQLVICVDVIISYLRRLVVGVEYYLTKLLVWFSGPWLKVAVLKLQGGGGACNRLFKTGVCPVFRGVSAG